MTGTPEPVQGEAADWQSAAPFADDDGALAASVAAVFARPGVLARSDPHYLPREGQQQMAAAVARAITLQQALVVEAGTGVGKTYAYLVPVLLSGERTLLCTATKTLQDQLFLRDLPRLREWLGVPLRAALLKGRANYLCLHRMRLARQQVMPSDRWALRTLARIEQWAPVTVGGELSELDGLDERSPVLPLVTSTRDNCLGSDCPDFGACHVMRARREAMAADLVVINHHLYFADMSLRDSGVAELLPSVDVVVFDEAHQLVEAGVQFLATTLATSQALDLARDLQALGLQKARGLAPWAELAAALEHAARELRLVLAGDAGDGGWGGRREAVTQRLAWSERADDPALPQGLERLQHAARQVQAALQAVQGAAAELDKLAERVAAMVALCALFIEPAAPGQVRWIDLSAHQARLVQSPLDIAQALTEHRRQRPRAWVFTSATLGDDERLSWFCDSAGLGDARVLRASSPFDYATHARLFVPRKLPKPGGADHLREVASLAARCARTLGGRCFVLTTTLRALQTVAAELQALLEADDISVLVQGSAPKRALIDRFVGQPRQVLVGSHSFWEGVDVPGDALQCVLIDKLPFPPPNDPLVQARVQRAEAQGRNAFVEVFVAEAAVALKQGAGRLIRSETDLGLLVVCDPRMAQMGYGRRLQQALPPMQRLEHEAQALEWLAQLAAMHPPQPGEGQPLF
jgi:ATP-dependent DNA helicase DinG